MIATGTTAQKVSKPISSAIEDLYLNICKEIAEIAVIEEIRIGNKRSSASLFYKYFKALITITRSDIGLNKRDSANLLAKIDLWFSQKNSLKDLAKGIELAISYNKLLFDSGILTLGSSIRNK